MDLATRIFAPVTDAQDEADEKAPSVAASVTDGGDSWVIKIPKKLSVEYLTPCKPKVKTNPDGTTKVIPSKDAFIKLNSEQNITVDFFRNADGKEQSKRLASKPIQTNLFFRLA
jgi:hypothetical protein